MVTLYRLFGSEHIYDDTLSQISAIVGGCNSYLLRAVGRVRMSLVI